MAKQKQITELCQTLAERQKHVVFCRIDLVDGKAPTKVMLFPKPDLTGSIDARDGRQFKMFDQEAIAAAFNASGDLLPFDLEHASELKAPNGEAAFAYGWIVSMVAEGGELYAIVEWTSEGAALIESKKYRYVSPAFRRDPETSRITQVVSAGLTNRPALKMPALTSVQGVTPMNPALLKLLGLDDKATPEQIDAATKALEKKISEKEAQVTAVQAELTNVRSATPSLAHYVPRAEHDAVRTELASMKQAQVDAAASAFKAEVASALDAAVTAGKLTPASKPLFAASCTTKEGFEEFKKYIGTASVIVSGTAGKDKPAAGGEGGASGKITTASAEQIKIWARQGISEKRGIEMLNEA